MRLAGISLCCVAVAVSPASAQHDHSPYADQVGGEIASLSDQELSDLGAGAGMGLARVAELNHYPGPKHVLELADSLGLTPDQRQQVAAIREAMLEWAVRLGEQIIEAERVLSTRFEHEHVDSATVETATAEIGGLYGALRYRHLAAHLAVKDLLTPDQVAAYDRLRGYGPSR
jgi:Spy/CpxP family protein refolding chaperone